ncbi:MAG: hypothetical protein WAW87_03955 [Candidatus Ferrigenium altingense]
MQYLSNKTFTQKTIDLANATLDELLDAYNSLNEWSDSHGAFPGSKQWATAQAHQKTLDSLISARPEIAEYRKQKISADRAKTLSGIDVMGA